MFAATYVDKNAEVDNEHEGCDPTTRVCVIADTINVTSPTLAGLLRKLSERFCYDGMYWDMSGEEGVVQWARFDQHEDAHGTPLVFDEVTTVWKSGGKVFLAEYTFWIEERDIRPVSADNARELEDEGFLVAICCDSVSA